MNPNYIKICSNLLSELSSRPKEVISRRFGLEKGERETLEAIGDSFGITRERVRQIEEAGLEKIRPEIKDYQVIFQGFYDYFKKHGGIKKEAILLADLGGEKNQSQIYFLLSLDKNFIRLSESEEFYPLWTTDKNNLAVAQKTINFLFDKLKSIGKPLSFKELKSLQPGEESTLNSYLEISEKIQRIQKIYSV